jgi:4-hydroxybenzoate polyprenyltransferase
MEILKYLVISLRPKDWIKNFFVIAPLFFSKKMMDISILTRVLFGFILFCLFSSSIYLLNDIIDVGKDTYHPKKSKRPLASGKISAATLLFISFALLFCSVVGSYLLDERFLVVALLYWFINVFYTLHLKHLAIIDVICIAIGFVLRVIAGGMLVNVPSSHWILTTTIFLSLFLGFSKRRGEIALSIVYSDKSSRPVLEKYSISLLDQFLIICATASIMSYTLFTVSDYAFKRFGTHNLIYTIPFVIYGIFRYLYLIGFTEYYESPTETLLTDKMLIVNILLWIICVILIVYK